MNEKHKIEKMKNEGRITPEQAELLLHAVNESEQPNFCCMRSTNPSSADRRYWMI
jgi:hypothetical protein